MTLGGRLADWTGLDWTRAGLAGWLRIEWGLVEGRRLSSCVQGPGNKGRWEAALAEAEAGVLATEALLSGQGISEPGALCRSTSTCTCVCSCSCRRCKYR